jgi:magnesium-protoporphyrin O-methyltransferase
MVECHCGGFDQRFTADRAARELATYRRRGPAQATTRLIAALQERAIAGMTLLDIGSGIGVIPQTLLQSRVRHALDVDASAAYIEAARGEVERLGLSDRMQFALGNFVTVAETIPVADIVTLDRVICCFDDMPALVSLSAARAGRLYGLVLPRDVWWTRLLGWVRNRLRGLTRLSLRFFIYAPADVDAIVRAQGLKLRSLQTVGMWQVMLYTRTSPLTTGSGAPHEAEVR